MERTIASLAALPVLAAAVAAATAATQTTTYAASGDHSASICEGGLCFGQTYTYTG